MSKHTPGPWYVAERHDDGDVLYTVEADGLPVAYIYRKAEREANARLIAAAPEMFDMLHKAREAFARKLSGDYGAELLQDFCGDIDDLLNKVRGEWR